MATKISVYGAEIICASCVNAPSSKDTYEWLQAALARKFKDNQFEFEYIDIHEPSGEAEHKQFADKVIEEDLFYPVVLVDGEIAGEGMISLKAVAKAVEKAVSAS
ncbi:Disulfide oxidoreductase YuzD [Terribacillus aidingensis]|uniref:Disulfide oxidoreductase YuzD n=1 Tax=Terribacillus aidingensis TaxID=586416 RepID=A0A285NDX8_9BACI|nr:YuzD family protein [Terribacillus aidingensis]SNZ05861.1 Disulfide oxidoreductase YuzD [Terribacillus aidingensis]